MVTLRLEPGKQIRCYINGERDYRAYAIEDKSFIAQRVDIPPGRLYWIEIDCEINVTEDEYGRKTIEIVESKGVRYGEYENEDENDPIGE
jgi:hypothetical protein